MRSALFFLVGLGAGAFLGIGIFEVANHSRAVAASEHEAAIETAKRNLAAAQSANDLANSELEKKLADANGRYDRLIVETGDLRQAESIDAKAVEEEAKRSERFLDDNLRLLDENKRLKLERDERGPSKSAPKVSSDSEEFGSKIASFHWNADRQDVAVLGELHNAGSTAYAFAIFRIAAYDKNGNLLGMTQEMINNFGPKQTKPFECNILDAKYDANPEIKITFDSGIPKK